MMGCKICVLFLAFMLLVIPAFAEADKLDIAKQKYKTGEFVKAEKECEKFLHSHPTDAEALRLKGKCLLAQGNFDTAVLDLQSANWVDGPLEQAMSKQFSVETDDPEDADYPDWVESLLLLYSAKISGGQGQFDHAVKICDLALSKCQVFPECTKWRARFLLRLNRLDEAAEGLREGLSMRPKDWHMWLGYAHVLERQYKFPQALAALDKAIDLIKTPPYLEPDLKKDGERMVEERNNLASKSEYSVWEKW